MWSRAPGPTTRCKAASGCCRISAQRRLTAITTFELRYWLSSSAGPANRHPRPVNNALRHLDTVRVEALDGKPFPVQVDGDYIGFHEEAEYRAVPRADGGGVKADRAG